MNRNTWIIVLVVAGIGAAIAIGLTARSQSNAQGQYCDSLASLKTSVNNLLAFDPSTATLGQLQSDVSAVQDSWNDVRSSAENVHEANVSSLQGAWNGFTESIKGIGSGRPGQSGTLVATSAKGLQSAVNSAIGSYDCAPSGSTTTTTATTTP